MAGTYTLTIVQGQTLSLNVQIKSSGVAVNVSTYTFAGKIRSAFTSTSALDDLTIGFVTDGTDGWINISLTAAETAALATPSSSPNPNERLQSLGVYDVEMTNGSTVTRILEGNVKLSLEATK